MSRIPFIALLVGLSLTGGANARSLNGVPLARCILAPDGLGTWWQARYKFRVCVGDQVLHTTFLGGFKAEVMAINRINSSLLLKRRDNTERWVSASDTWLEVQTTGLPPTEGGPIRKHSYVQRKRLEENLQFVRHIFLKRPGQIMLQTQDCLTGQISLHPVDKYKLSEAVAPACPAQQTHGQINDDNLHF